MFPRVSGFLQLIVHESLSVCGVVIGVLGYIPLRSNEPEKKTNKTRASTSAGCRLSPSTSTAAVTNQDFTFTESSVSFTFSLDTGRVK